MTNGTVDAFSPVLAKLEQQPIPNNPDWQLSRAEISFPGLAASETLTAFNQCELLMLKHGEDHQKKLTFNNAQQGQFLRIAPDLPLIVEW